MKHAPGEIGPACGMTPFQFPEDIAVTLDEVVTCPNCATLVVDMLLVEVEGEILVLNDKHVFRYEATGRWRRLSDGVMYASAELLASAVASGDKGTLAHYVPNRYLIGNRPPLYGGS